MRFQKLSSWKMCFIQEKSNAFHRLQYVCDLLAIRMGLYSCTHCHSKVKQEIRQKLDLCAHRPWVKVICKVIIHNWSLYYPGTALVDGNRTQCILSFYAILSFLHDLVAPLYKHTLDAKISTAYIAKHSA